MNNPKFEQEQSRDAQVSLDEEIRYGEGRVLEYETIGTLGKFNNVSRAVSRSADELSQIVSTLFPRAAESMAITDADRRILWVNETLEENSGYSLEELRGRYAVQLFFGALTDPAAAARIRRAVRRGVSCSEELVLYRKGGHPYWTRLTYSPILAADGFVRAIVVIGHALPEKPLP